MKKLFSFLIVLITGFVFLCCTVQVTYGTNSSTIKFKAAVGTDTVYGSILKPRENRLIAKLTSGALKAIRETRIENVTASITKIASENETSSVCAISTDNLTLIGKKVLIDVLPCTNTNGATVTAGALEDGNYRLSLTAGSQTFSGTFS